MSVLESLRKLFHRRKSKSSPKVEPSQEVTPPILMLPVDVLCYVVDSIPRAEAASLAMTSKVILNTVGRQVLKIEKAADRAEFLKHMEVHFPNHILCYQCGKFHYRRSEVQRRDQDTECDKKNGEFCSNTWVLNPPFSRIQEIMNRHRYGEEYGAPVEELNITDTWPIAVGQSRLEETKAKIIKNELFIRTDVRYLYPRRRRGKNIAMDQYHQYCPHLTSLSLNANSFDSWKKTYIRCPECHAEIRFMITYYSKYRKQAHTTVWYNLGHCRSPFEGRWRAVTESGDIHPGNEITRRKAKYIKVL